MAVMACMRNFEAQAKVIFTSAIFFNHLNLQIMTTKKFSVVVKPLNVEIHQTAFLTGAANAQTSQKRHGLKIACLLFF